MPFASYAEGGWPFPDHQRNRTDKQIALKNEMLPRASSL